ncbi:MAG: hypothetical protein LC620_07435, partial [Halobacteriales archaeon]|nr:hypothetical protein [Halobacteriales archaeon]
TYYGDRFKCPLTADPYHVEEKETPFDGGQGKALCHCAEGSAQKGQAGTVEIYNGEFKFPLLPAELPAQRGMGFQFDMTYRSRSPNATAGDDMFGSKWDYAYGAYLLKNTTTLDLQRHNGDGRMDLYRYNGVDWNTPLGKYDAIAKLNSTAYRITDRYGHRETYTQETTLWPYAGSPAKYRLTFVEDNKGNNVKIWPGRAAIDSQNRLVYFGHDGIYEYEGLYLNDTKDRVHGYSVAFNWTTAYWNVFDSSGHRIASDPYDPNEIPCPAAVHWEDFDPSPEHRTYGWEYGRQAWNQENDFWNDGLATPACDDGWNGAAWTHGYWNGRPDDDDDNWTLPLPAPTVPASPPDEAHNNNTLDNWPNCDYAALGMPSRECLPDSNVNWTLQLRTLAEFQYDAAGRLVHVKLPGNAWTNFTYDGDLLLTVSDANNQTYVNNTYDEHGRVWKQHYGYGDYEFQYDTVNRVTRTKDRNGNVADHYYESWQRPLTWLKVVYTNRDMNPSDPDSFQTRYAYNQHMELTSTHYPRGNWEKFIYDDTNPLRLSQGNLLCHIKDPGPFVTGLNGQAEWPEITNYTYENEFNQVVTVTDARAHYPGYLPPNGGNATLQRYTTRYQYEHQEATVGPSGGPLDLNGDGVTNRHHPNLIKTEYALVNPEGAPHAAFGAQYSNQVRTETWQYNAEGQPTRHTDPLGTSETWEYIPASQSSAIQRNWTTGDTPWFWNPAYAGLYNAGIPHGMGTWHSEALLSGLNAHLDPSDAEGYLLRHTQDVGGFNLATNYTRDPDGNPTSITAPNGATTHLGFTNCLLGNVTSPKGAETGITRDRNGLVTNITRDVYPQDEWEAAREDLAYHLW